MKLVGNYKEWSVSQTLLANILDVSQPRINQMIDEGIVLRDETSKGSSVLLIDSARNYWLSKNVSGGGVDFWKEKGLHERAKRQLTELKVREREGELYEAEVVEAVMSEHLTNFRTKLLGLASKFATQLESKTRGEIYDMLTLEIEMALDELARNYRLADFTTDTQIEEDEDEE